MKLNNNNDPYFEQIKNYLYQQFPKISQPTNCELLEILTNILNGTKEIRYGTLPSPESLVVIRQTIRESIQNNHAIPVLVPWGSMKADFTGTLDVAEVSAISRLVQTNNLVKEFYPLGLDIVIRVEDTSGYELFSIDANPLEVRTRVATYSEEFRKLVSILSDDTIRVIKESSMVGSTKFKEIQDFYKPFFLSYIEDSETIIRLNPDAVIEMKSYKNLQAIGWQGIISAEQRDFYYDSYKRNYSNESLNQKRLALYMAQSLTRRRLNMSGKQDYWTSFIQITFVQPVKGLPTGYHNNCIYYRTIPLSQGRTHICPWRAKGYLKITNSHVCAKLTTHHDEIDLIPCIVEMQNEKHTVRVNINYHLDEGN